MSLRISVARATLHALVNAHAHATRRSDSSRAEDKSGKIVFAASKIPQNLIQKSYDINKSKKDVKERLWNEGIFFFNK